MIGDRIDWVSDKPRGAMVAYALWLGAVKKADQGDKEPLIALLRSNEVLGPDARDLIADFLNRHNLKKPRGGQATPAYRMTPAEGWLHHQAAGVRYWKKKGLSHEDAIRAALRDDKREEIELKNYPELAPDDEQLDEMITDKEFTLLENFIAGRRGSSRRMRRRRSG